MSIQIIYLAILCFTITSLWTIIKLRSSRILFLYVPLTIFIVGATIFQYQELLGYPAKRELPEDARLIAYEIEPPTAIYVWIVPLGHTVPISLVLPYEKGTKDQLDSNAEKIKEGRAALKSKKKGGGEKGEGGSGKGKLADLAGKLRNALGGNDTRTVEYDELLVYDFVDQILSEGKEHQ